MKTPSPGQIKEWPMPSLTKWESFLARPDKGHSWSGKLKEWPIAGQIRVIPRPSSGKFYPQLFSGHLYPQLKVKKFKGSPLHRVAEQLLKNSMQLSVHSHYWYWHIVWKIYWPKLSPMKVQPPSVILLFAWNLVMIPENGHFSTCTWITKWSHSIGEVTLTGSNHPNQA